MKRRIISIMLAASMVAGLAAGCGSPDTSTNGGDGGTNADSSANVSGDNTEEGKVINIYCWNDEFPTRVNAIYSRVESVSDDATVTYLNDGTEIHWVINPNADNVYQDKLDEALLRQTSAADDEKIDIFLTDVDSTVKYTDADANVAMPLKDLGIDPDVDLADQYDFTKTIASDANGVQRGSTWQCSPGLLAYRRDIAKAVFGTDDPDVIAEKTKDWDTMQETAQVLKDAGYYTFAGYTDTYRTFSNNAAAPWVAAGETTVKIDPQIMRWINDSEEWVLRGYFDPTVKGVFNADWNAAVASKSKVFAFMLPAWGIDFMLKPNWDGEEGSWGITAPPQGYNWGGSYIHACTGTDNPVHVKEIILEMTANKDNLLEISKKYSDFTNTKSGMAEAALDDATFADPFFAGQNPFKYFAPAADSIQMPALSPYDLGCAEEIQSAFADYFQDTIDFDKAKVNFETAIIERFPELQGVDWGE